MDRSSNKKSKKTLREQFKDREPSREITRLSTDELLQLHKEKATTVTPGKESPASGNDNEDIRDIMAGHDEADNTSTRESDCELPEDEEEEEEVLEEPTSSPAKKSFLKASSFENKSESKPSGPAATHALFRDAPRKLPTRSPKANDVEAREPELPTVTQFTIQNTAVMNETPLTSTSYKTFFAYWKDHEKIYPGQWPALLSNIEKIKLLRDMRTQQD
jgi:hypothetical protein